MPRGPRAGRGGPVAALSPRDECPQERGGTEEGGRRPGAERRAEACPPSCVPSPSPPPPRGASSGRPARLPRGRYRVCPGPAGLTDAAPGNR